MMMTNIVRAYVNLFDEMNNDPSNAYALANHLFALMCDDINDTDDPFTRDDTNAHVNVADITRDMSINPVTLTPDDDDPDHVIDAARELADAFDTILSTTPSFTLPDPLNDPRVMFVRFLDDDDILYEINVVTRSIVRL